MYRKTGSSTVIDGHGISKFIEIIEDKWAEWSEQQSSLLPSNIGKGLITTLVFDNIEWKNKDHKGKETHNTNSILIHEIPSQCNFTRVNLNPNYDFERSKHRSFKAFETNLEPVTFKRSQCKDLIYKKNNYEEEYNDSKNRILAWVMPRLTISHHSEQSIPSWSGFQQLLAETPPKASIGYLPPITAPPTEMSVIYAFIDRAFKILMELEMEKMFIEADQAIYSKLFDAMFKLSEDGHDVFSKLVPRMGGFHIIMCMLKTIFSRFKDSGISKLFGYSGISGEGTIKHALKGGDVKFGSHLHKLMFEAITTSKLTGGLLCYLELYLDIVTLLLNTIYAQRTGNWKGLLQCIREFLPYCFSLNCQNYARNLSYCYIHITDLENLHEDMFSHMLNQGFTGSLSGQLFTLISCDQVIEMTINCALLETKTLEDCQEKQEMLVQVSVRCELTI